MRKCRVCQQEISDTSRLCEHCGEDLIGGRKPIAVTAAPVDPHPRSIPIDPEFARRSSGSLVFTGLLVAASLGSGALGLALLSQATTGVGLLCAACFLGILARLVQAGVHHRVILEALAKR